MKTKSELVDCANLVEYEYKAGEMQGIIEACPEEKVIYTECDDDGGSYIIVGLRLCNRFAVYFGDDLGLKDGTIFPSSRDN